MPLDIRVDGDPEALRARGQWLREVAGQVRDCVSQVHRARSESEGAWGGESGENFRSSAQGMATKGDNLEADNETVGRGFEKHGDDLDTVRSRMEQARQVCADAGITTTPSSIADPGPAPSAPLPGSERPTGIPAIDTGNQHAAKEHAAWQRQHAAYQEATKTVEEARKLQRNSQNTLERLIGDVIRKTPLTAADVLTGLAGARIAQVSKWRAASASYARNASAATKLMTNPSMSEVRRQKAMILKVENEVNKAGPDKKLATKFSQMAESFAEKRPWAAKQLTSGIAPGKIPSGTKFGKGAAVLGKIPRSGVALSGIGAVADIMSGKDPTKSIVSAGASTAASAGVSALMVSNPIGWGVAASAAAGIGVGFVVDEYGDEIAGFAGEAAEWTGERFSDVKEFLGL